jgi:hypothetical protein
VLFEALISEIAGSGVAGTRPDLTKRRQEMAFTFLARVRCRIGIHAFEEKAEKNIGCLRWIVYQECAHCHAERVRSFDEWDQMTGI